MVGMPEPVPWQRKTGISKCCSGRQGMGALGMRFKTNEAPLLVVMDFLLDGQHLM